MEKGYPDLETAREMLAEAEAKNPGPWGDHSRNVALAAKNIAEGCPELDPEKAYVLGLLHDIGRREGPHGMRHALDGYRYCMSLGFPDCARICITHSCPTGRMEEALGGWNCTEEECRFVGRFLSAVVADDYDRLIQLCDALALPSGFSLMEKRLVDVFLRHGVNEYTQAKIKALFSIKDHFESLMGKSVYTVLPGVVENTFA
jgi:hypothetical protein